VQGQDRKFLAWGQEWTALTGLGAGSWGRQLWHGVRIRRLWHGESGSDDFGRQGLELDGFGIGLLGGDSFDTCFRVVACILSVAMRPMMHRVPLRCPMGCSHAALLQLQAKGPPGIVHNSHLVGVDLSTA